LIAYLYFCVLYTSGVTQAVTQASHRYNMSNNTFDASAASATSAASAASAAASQENENKDYEDGYLYCVSNVSMPGILNIGMTWMSPELRMIDINRTPGLWQPPTPYKCEFAKKVRNLEYKKDVIYKLLAKSRINPIRKFFRISLEDTRTLFDLMDGDYWENGDVNDVNDIEDIEDVTGVTEVTEDDECSIWNIPLLDERFEKRKAEIKATEKKMLDCLFQKSDDLASNLTKIEKSLVERKMELKEINEVIEERKAELASLASSNDKTDAAGAAGAATTGDFKGITEY